MPPRSLPLLTELIVEQSSFLSTHTKQVYAFTGQIRAHDSHITMDMSGMSGMDSGSDSSSSGSMMSMSQMQMTFFSAQTTPLYSTAWTPSGTGTYAATCIFLIILCALSRFLWAWKLILDRRLQYRSSAAARRIVGYTDEEDDSSDPHTSKGSDSPRRRRLKEQFHFGRNWGPVPWRLYIDLPRAIVFTILLGVGYLL